MKEHFTIIICRELLVYLHHDNMEMYKDQLSENRFTSLEKLFAYCKERGITALCEAGINFKERLIYFRIERLIKKYHVEMKDKEIKELITLVENA